MRRQGQTLLPMGIYLSKIELLQVEILKNVFTGRSGTHNSLLGVKKHLPEWIREEIWDRVFCFPHGISLVFLLPLPGYLSKGVKASLALALSTI